MGLKRDLKNEPRMLIATDVMLVTTGSIHHSESLLAFVIYKVVMLGPFNSRVKILFNINCSTGDR